MTGSKLSLRTKALPFKMSHTKTLPRHVTANTCCEALSANLAAGDDRTSGGRGRWPKQMKEMYFMTDK
jgi:hypothetical protein